MEALEAAAAAAGGGAGLAAGTRVTGFVSAGVIQQGQPDAPAGLQKQQQQEEGGAVGKLGQ
jgi:hypothetical protein